MPSHTASHSCIKDSNPSVYDYRVCIFKISRCNAHAGTCTSHKCTDAPQASPCSLLGTNLPRVIFTLTSDCLYLYLCKWGNTGYSLFCRGTAESAALGCGFCKGIHSLAWFCKGIHSLASFLRHYVCEVHAPCCLWCRIGLIGV